LNIVLKEMNVERYWRRKPCPTKW